MELFRARRGSPTNTSTDRCSSKIGTNQFALTYGLIREVIATAAGQVERLTLNASETAALPPGISTQCCLRSAFGDYILFEDKTIQRGLRAKFAGYLD
jgi:hypothetical protein